MTSSIGARLLPVTPGEFVMGSPATETGHRFWEGQRQVSLSHSFYLGETPVTQCQYERIVGNNPTDHPGPVEDAPVDSVNWQAATEYCRKLSERDSQAGILCDGWEYRLPTETEWEYACRAGSTTATYGPLDSIAWHFGNSQLRTHPVRAKAPNAWGFFDMLGNVWEMCQDIFWGKHQQHSCRGGSYFNTLKCCRAAARFGYMGGRYCGFRLVAAPVETAHLCPPLEDFPSPPPQPSIFEAFQANDLALARQILSDDPSQLEDVDGIPPTLHACIYADLPEMFEWLLDQGANIECREQDYGSPPLNNAVVWRRKRIIQTLIERGADSSQAMSFAKRGLAGEFEHDPQLDREGYREIVDFLRELGVQ